MWRYTEKTPQLFWLRHVVIFTDHAVAMIDDFANFARGTFDILIIIEERDMELDFGSKSN